MRTNLLFYMNCIWIKINLLDGCDLIFLFYVINWLILFLIGYTQFKVICYSGGRKEALEFAINFKL